MKYITYILLLCSSITMGQIPLELPEIEGKVKSPANPSGWTTYTGSPDIVAGEGVWNNSVYTLEHITGEGALGNTMVWMMFVRESQPEAMQTELKGLKIGEEYSVSVLWQQCAMMQGNERMYWGGDLLIIVDGDSTIFTSEGVHDDWQRATVIFTASAKTATFVLSMYNPDYDSGSKWGGCIVVDNGCTGCAADCQKYKEAGK